MVEPEARRYTLRFASLSEDGKGCPIKPGLFHQLITKAASRPRGLGATAALNVSQKCENA